MFSIANTDFIAFDFPPRALGELKITTTGQKELVKITFIQLKQIKRQSFPAMRCNGLDDRIAWGFAIMFRLISNWIYACFVPPKFPLFASAPYKGLPIEGYPATPCWYRLLMQLTSFVSDILVQCGEVAGEYLSLTTVLCVGHRRPKRSSACRIEKWG